MTRTGREQVVEALRDRIIGGLHVGRLSGGERLTSTRGLAEEFGVNERVVLAALRVLADEGFISLRPRSGAYIVPPHPAGGKALPDLGAWLVSMLVQARARGLPPRDVSEYVRRCTETRRVHAACIECNHDQIHLLCTELAADHGYVTEGADMADLGAAEPSLALRRADILVTTLFHTQEVQAAAQRLDKPWLAVALRPEALGAAGRALREGIVYFIATDQRFQPKLLRMLATVGPTANARVLLAGTDDLDIVPSNAPTFVMTSARSHVADRYGARGLGIPIHPPRSFSDETAQQLLTFLVRANMATLAAGLA